MPLKIFSPEVSVFADDKTPLDTSSSFKNKGASFDIDITLYLASSLTKSLASCLFFNIKKVSSVTLFLSDYWAEENPIYDRFDVYGYVV